MDFLEDILCLLISTVTYSMAEMRRFFIQKKPQITSILSLANLSLATRKSMTATPREMKNVQLVGCIANDYHHHKIPPKRHSAQKQQTHSFVDASMRSQHP